jgi:flagellar basal-body rod protein FlgB
MLDDTVFGLLKRGLSLSNFKHELISDNLANISTPKYSRKDLDFRKLMSEKIGNSSMPGRMTDSKHMTFVDGVSTPSVAYPSNTEVRSNGNNVDLDVEIVSMAENTIYYNTLSTLLQRRYKMVRNVITGR